MRTVKTIFIFIIGSIYIIFKILIEAANEKIK